MRRRYRTIAPRPARDGDTIYLCTADADGMGVADHRPGAAEHGVAVGNEAIFARRGQFDLCVI